MWKSVQLFPFLLFCLIHTAAKAQNFKPGLSANTRQFLWLWKNGKTDAQGVIPNYVYYKDGQSKLYINALARLNPHSKQHDFEKEGLISGMLSGNIKALKITIGEVEKWAHSPLFDYLDLDMPMAAHLDSALRRTRVDSAHAGLGLPQAYTGKDVVIGIIDAGFDYTHPTFYDSLGQRYRVRKAWIQKLPGTAPSAFGYGSELADSAAMHNQKYDVTETSHGTHVGGIAGGSGLGSPASHPRRYRGVAYESDLVFTAIYPSAEYWLNTGMVDMLDGIRYTYNYAQSVGKPAVANLSWGCPLGPRDGSSLFSQALDSLVGPGKLFVVSGGNNGQNKIHFAKTFTPADTITHTFMTFSSSLTPRVNQADIWGETGQNFQVQFSLYNANTRLGESAWIPLDGETHFIKIKGSNNDSVYITATGVMQEFNQKPHLLYRVTSRVNDRLCISIKATPGQLHMWQGIVVKTSGYYGTFTRFSYTWAKEGDTDFVTGDLVSTRRAIAVAAYNTKVNFTNVSGQTLSYSGYSRGRLALFSSMGPTADGRVKPDVAAPGMALASAFSSFDPDYAPMGADEASVVHRFTSPVNNRSYPFGMAGGTSMAAPMTSGILALVLQIYPELSPEDVFNWFSETCIKDNLTGAIPPQGTTSWGRGRINAMGLLRKALSPTHTQNLNLKNALRIYPNPNSGQFLIEMETNEEAKPMEVRLTDALGRIVPIRTNLIEGGSLHVELDNVPKGIYFLMVRMPNKVLAERVIIR